MNAEYHVVASIPIAASFYAATGSFLTVAGVFLGGVLIDVDHLLEYWLDEGFNVRIKEFFAYGNQGGTSRFLFIFHSYEVIIILILCSFALPVKAIIWSVIAGMSVHLVLDYINILNKLGYRWYSCIIFSFFFRLALGFRRDLIEKMVLPRSNRKEF